MLEEPTKVDIISVEDGCPVLVIADAGITTDPDRRLDMLDTKLRNYGVAIASVRFRQEYPAADHARIEVNCQNPPTDKMKSIQQITVRHPDGKEQQVPVSFKVFSI